MPAKRTLFPALLRYWRNRCGLSQLDLALSADVSSRHVSFLETGRAQPSREMVLRLSAALRVPLRDRNAMLHAAGFADGFDEPDLEAGLTAPVRRALDHMLEQHEPFPLVIMDRHYTILSANRAVARLMRHFIAEPGALTLPPNMVRMLFDPRLGRPFVVNWEATARGMVSRLHIEALAHPNDRGLSEFVAELFSYPDVPQSWRQPDFSVPSEPIAVLRLRRDELEVAFFTTITMFSAPGNVTLDELRIESSFPVDEATEQVCRKLANESAATNTD